MTEAPAEEVGGVAAARPPAGDLTTAALQYLANGHHLLALHEKRPNPRFHARPADSDEPGWSWDRSIHNDDGLPLADTDIAAVDAIFSDPTTTGIALLVPAGALVADIDTPRAAEIYMKHAGALPTDTCVSKTPNGLHVWFLAPGYDGGVWLEGKEGLLFKGLGGYVAAPPSAHFNAKGEQDGVYQWLGDTAVIAPLPKGIARALADARAVASLTPVRFSESGGDVHCEWDSKGRLVAMWPDWHIDGLLKAVRESGEGNRNNMLAWAALTAAEEGATIESTMPSLLQAALDAGLSRRESVTTIRAAFKRRRGG